MKTPPPGYHASKKPGRSASADAHVSRVYVARASQRRCDVRNDGMNVVGSIPSAGVPVVQRFGGQRLRQSTRKWVRYAGQWSMR